MEPTMEQTIDDIMMLMQKAYDNGYENGFADGAQEPHVEKKVYFNNIRMILERRLLGKPFNLDILER